MIDLEIMDGGKVVLNRNIKKGEIITYQNSYLKRVNQTDIVEILEDLNKEDILYSGALSNGRVVASKDENTADYLVIKKEINVLDVWDRVFYIKENGEVFECFKNKQMKPVCADELYDLMMNGRQKKISFISIVEQQVNELVKMFKDKKLRKLALNQEMTIKSYKDYKIISDERFKELLELLKN